MENFRNRYIYTKRNGWIDMLHFMFYAGMALEFKSEGALPENAEANAVQLGKGPELVDQFSDPSSAYSYEDLPSDALGALFAAYFFDPDSGKTLGEQLSSFFALAEATSPRDAPNYSVLPDTETNKPPMMRNHSTKGMFTVSITNEERQRLCELGNSAACNY